MIDAPNIADELAQSGYTDYVGVPCSHLSPLIATAQSAPRLSYIAAANEGDAIAIGLGAHLGGRKTVILSQNSGLGNMVNPLTSLLRPFQVPMLLMITWRGEPGVPDEPQHEQMGSITPDLLNLLDVSWEFLPNTPCEALKAIRRGCEYVDHEQRVFAFVIRPNTLSGHITLRPSRDCRAPAVNRTWTGTSSERPTRIDAMQELLSQERGDEVYIATTGYTGRELFSLNDRANNLYVVGGMGTAASIGFGLANARRCQPVVVLDGDGSLLMRMGSLALLDSMDQRTCCTSCLTMNVTLLLEVNRVLLVSFGLINAPKR